MADVGPAPEFVACGTCGRPVDALRAARVRCVAGSYWFFCSGEHAEGFDPERSVGQPVSVTRGTPEQPSAEAQPPPPSSLEPATARSRLVSETLARLAEQPAPSQPLGSSAAALLAEPPPTSSPLPALGAATPERPAGRHPLGPLLQGPSTVRSGAAAGSTPTTAAPPGQRAPARAAAAGAGAQDLLLVGVAAVSGALSLALTLAGPTGSALTARLVVVVAGCGVLVAHGLLSRRDPRQLDRASFLLAPLASTLASLGARIAEHPATATALTTAGALITVAALVTFLVDRTTRPTDQARLALAEAFQVGARRCSGQLTEHCTADELRPGEEVLVEAGETVPADGTIVAGHAQVLPWRGSEQVEERGEGDPIVAGARLIDGALRIVTGWTGADRAWLRLTVDRRRRADLRSGTAHTAQLVARRGALAAAGLVLVIGAALGTEGLLVILAAAAVHGAFAHAGTAELAAVRMGRASLEGLEHGIAFHEARHLDEAGRVTVAALCARGTILLGEPEVAGIEPLDEQSPEDLLALAAGAESAVHHPVATAVLRAARARGVRADATRNHTPVAGLGVTAVAASGKSLVVGSRALMLREKVSVARAEQRITELEALGRSALLVAVDGRLVGILALQDGMRTGARAAVQHLLDLGVEPVLLSGDSRETTEAIARSIDIEHVRPDLPAPQRGDEVKQLAAGGAVVAVVGRSPVDDIALGAADVSVTLRAAAASNADWSIGLVSDDVRDAARALRIARRARDAGRAILTVVIVPPTLAALAVAFGLVTPALAPGAALLGTLAGIFRGRDD